MPPTDRFVVMKLRFLRHFDVEPVQADPHGTGRRMAQRYVLRVVQLVHLVGRCAELEGLRLDKAGPFMRALDKLVEVKRNINRMVLHGVDLTARTGPAPAEKLADVPAGAMRAEVRAAHDLFADAHAEHAGPGKRSKAQWYLDDLFEEVRQLADDLTIDACVYLMPDPTVTEQLLRELLDAWLDVRAAVIACE